MDERPYAGMLITIEGIDGCGKSSAARALADTVSKHHSVLLTKEPGATQLGKQVRQFLQTRTCDVSPAAEFLLFAADRAQHMHEIVLPALQEGKIVISDRMADSSRAYQGFGRGLDDTWIQNINRWAMKNISPNLTFYLKIDYQTAMSRLKKRNEQATVFEQERVHFFERVIEGFETIFKERDSVITVDATQDQMKVHQIMLEKVLEIL